MDKGYERASVGDIAKRAGMGQGTLYRYVDGKRELLDLVFDKCVDDLMTAIAPEELLEQIDFGTSSSPERMTEQLADRLFSLVDSNPGLLKIITVQAGAVDEELRYRIAGLVQTFDGMIGRAMEVAQERGWKDRTGVDGYQPGRLAARLLPALALPGLVLTLTGDGDPQHRASFVAASGMVLRRGILAEGQK